MTDPDTMLDAPEPPRIRTLRRLVTALTVTLIGGMVIIVGLFIWRLAPAPGAAKLPAEVPLPRGETLTGYAQNPEWTVLITRDESGAQRLHLVTPGSTGIHQTTDIHPID